MNYRQLRQRIGYHILSSLKFIYPLVQVIATNRQIRRGAELRSRDPEIEALKDTGLRLDDASRAEVASAFSDEIARLRRLEDKLAWHMTVVTVLFGAIAAVAAWAIKQQSVAGLILAAGAFVWLGSAGFLTFEANRAVPLHIPDVIGSVQRGALDLPKYVAGERLQAIHLNPARGWQLSNALFGVQRNLLIAVFILMTSSLVTAASKPDHSSEPPRQVPRPSAPPPATPALLPSDSRCDQWLV